MLGNLRSGKRLHFDKCAANIECYKLAKRAAKRAVSVAKGKVYDDLYQRQGTLILPCSGHVQPADHAPCNVAILNNTTLGNGYLGSRIDEERSKMRYLV